MFYVLIDSMQMQVLDCDYVFVNTKPIVRIFCKTPEGDSACVFWDKSLPYFYVHADENYIDEVAYEIEKAICAWK